MILKKNINKAFYLISFFTFITVDINTFIFKCKFTLDTIEALAWGSNLDWGFNKHPPFSAFAVEFFLRYLAIMIGLIIF